MLEQQDIFYNSASAIIACLSRMFSLCEYLIQNTTFSMTLLVPFTNARASAQGARWSLSINISKENVSFIAQALDKDQRQKHSARFVTSYGRLPQPNSFPVFGDTILVILGTFTGKKPDFCSLPFNLSCHFGINTKWTNKKCCVFIAFPSFWRPFWAIFCLRSMRRHVTY